MYIPSQQARHLMLKHQTLQQHAQVSQFLQHLLRDQAVQDALIHSGTAMMDPVHGPPTHPEAQSLPQVIH
jgi:hypothetical protein